MTLFLILPVVAIAAYRVGYYRRGRQLELVVRSLYERAIDAELQLAWWETAVKDARVTQGAEAEWARWN